VTPAIADKNGRRGFLQALFGAGALGAALPWLQRSMRRAALPAGEQGVARVPCSLNAVRAEQCVARGSNFKARRGREE
jgi:hypothetical protein